MRARRGASVVAGAEPIEVARGLQAAAPTLNRAPLAAAMLSLAYAATLFQRLAFQGVGPLIGDELHLSGDVLADVAASFFWAYLILMIPGGILVDACGPRRVATLAACLSGTGCALFANAFRPDELIVARVLLSAGGALTFVAMMRFIVVAFHDRKSTVSGRAIFVGNIGAISAGAPLAVLLSLVVWRDVWELLAIGWLLLGAAIWLSMPQEASPQRSHSSALRMLRETGRILRSGHTWLAILVLAGLAGSYWAFANLIAVRVLSVSRLSSIESGLAISTLVCGYALGALVWGRAGDRFRREHLIVLACMLACAAWLAMTWIGALTLLVAELVFFLAGFGAGAFGLVYSVMTDRFPAFQGGTVIAVINCGIPLGAAILQSVAGRLPGNAAMLPVVVGATLAVFGALVLQAVAMRNAASEPY